MTKQKRHKHIYFLLCTTLFLSLFSLTAHANQTNDFGINTAPLDEIFETYSPKPNETQSDTFDNANSIELNNFFDVALNSLKSTLTPSLKTLFSLLSSIILISVIKNTNHALERKSYGSITNLITVLALTVMCYDLLKTTKDLTNTFIQSISSLINVLLPIMTSLYIFAGNISTSIVNTTGLSFLLTLINTVFTNFLYPLISICFGLTIAGNASNNKGISQINKTIRTIYNFVLTALITILSIYLLFKTNLSLAADNVTSRSIKFAGSFIPIIGGALGESVRSIMSGLSLIKNSVGMIGLFIVFAITLPVISNLILKKICIDISSAAAVILGCNEEADLLKDISGIINSVLALVFAVTVLFILELVIFVSISPSLGGAK